MNRRNFFSFLFAVPLAIKSKILPKIEAPGPIGPGHVPFGVYEKSGRLIQMQGRIDFIDYRYWGISPLAYLEWSDETQSWVAPPNTPREFFEVPHR